MVTKEPYDGRTETDLVAAEASSAPGRGLVVMLSTSVFIWLTCW